MWRCVPVAWIQLLEAGPPPIETGDWLQLAKGEVGRVEVLTGNYHALVSLAKRDAPSFLNLFLGGSE